MNESQALKGAEHLRTGLSVLYPDAIVKFTETRIFSRVRTMYFTIHFGEIIPHYIDAKLLTKEIEKMFPNLVVTKEDVVFSPYNPALSISFEAKELGRNGTYNFLVIFSS